MARMPPHTPLRYESSRTTVGSPSRAVAMRLKSTDEHRCTRISGEQNTTFMGVLASPDVGGMKFAVDFASGSQVPSVFIRVYPWSNSGCLELACGSFGPRR